MITIAEDIKTKKITQTPTGIEINKIKPINFYPRILIGFPKDYTV